MKIYIALTTLIVSLLLVGIFSSQANAATVEFKANHGDNEHYPNSEITVPISIVSSDPYNVFSVMITLENLEFIDLAPVGEWTTFIAPEQNENSITYTAALLGADKYAEGDSNVLDLKLKIPESGAYKINVSGTIALTDSKATQVTSEAAETSHNVGPSFVETVKADLQDQTSSTSIILRMVIGILAIIICFFVFIKLSKKYRI